MWTTYQSPLTWLTLFSQNWWLPDTQPPATFRPTQVISSDFSIQMALLFHASDFTKICLTGSIWPLCTLYLLLSAPRPGTRGSQPWFSAWLPQGTSKPTKSNSHLVLADFATPRWPQNQCTQYIASDHAGLQPYTLHKRYTQRVNSVSTKTSLKQVWVCRVDSFLVASPL